MVFFVSLNPFNNVKNFCKNVKILNQLPAEIRLEIIEISCLIVQLLSMNKTDILKSLSRRWGEFKIFEMILKQIMSFAKK